MMMTGRIKPVEDVLPGDEVMSLNEYTGELEYQNVEQTMDKGIQNTYLLITESGKKSAQPPIIRIWFKSPNDP